MNQQMAPMRRGRRPVPGASSFDKTNPFIYLGTVGLAKRARNRPGSLIAPLDLDPEILKWPVEGLSVMLITDPDRGVEAARLAGILLRDGAELVVVVNGLYEAARIHRHIGPRARTNSEARATFQSEPNFD